MATPDTSLASAAEAFVLADELVDPATEAHHLAHALERELAREARRGRRHIQRVEFPDTPRERTRNAPSAPERQRPVASATAPSATPPVPPSRKAAPPVAPQPKQRPAAGRPAHEPTSVPKPVRRTAAAPKLTIQTLRTRLGICMDCGLSAGPRGSGAIVGAGAHQPRLVIVSDFAGPAERQRGKVFGAQEAELIKNLVTRGYQLPQTAVYSTLAVKCPLGPGQRPSPGELRACGRHLADELALLAHDGLAGLLALGPLAAAALGHEGQRNASAQYKVGERTLPVVLTDHPRDMLADASLKAPAWKAMQALLPALGQQA